MCRYAGKTYKSHFVCFRCRKSFKQTHSSDILERVRKDKYFHKISRGNIRNVSRIFVKKEQDQLEKVISEIENREIKCPEYSSLMADLGLDFKAPKKSTAKEWKIVESLYRIGKVFHSCGCEGPGYIPQNLKDYEEYLMDRLEMYNNYQRVYQNSSEKDFPDKMERVIYWSQKIIRVQDEILRHGFNIR
ncbi:hypothetical protein [Chryseobacterium mucoviscidosis]|uniref:hypothetical protein n=1 Tax=Chryseobacterium mucoviscidosis TaxID=1945581 RepID=UPI0031E0575E